ncbi:Phosphotransferase enzyme family protein [Geodermatophilus telluris]|uniref:Phosphotransferase enzyme family protein n=1 Tax=Geodermatophilus telluris TaxID=1190417 RepID=A0A1G6L8L8_9ACTN|nr:aminoglycoside phosphotransferase family protein [Geodermatophilus telluris]SDC39498.1 Phosphotransferase enzyme family protein [Geodermatophilus telluris]
MTFVEELLRQHRAALGLDERRVRGMRTSVLTPRFTTSRHVVGMVSGARGRPELVVKVPRRAGDDSGTRREAHVLGLLAGTGVGAPQLVGLVEHEDRAVLVETVVRGAELDPARVRQDPEAAVAAGVAFVSALPVTRPADANAGWYERAVQRPLRSLVELVGDDGGDLAGLVERTHAVLAPLRDVAVPAVLEHADLSHPNLFLAADGSLQVIDWERADEHGVPGHDLVFLLGHLGEARRGAWTRDGQREAFDATFTGPAAWARPLLADHLRARGIDPALLPQVVVLAWARSSATLAERLVPAGASSSEDAGRPTPEQARAAVAADRDVALWRHALDRVEQL